MEKTALRLLLDASQCCACAGCVAVCPCAALGMHKLTLNIKQEKCNGCGYCALFCPTEALTLDH
jgi:Fe-S-cluster-containing hydrogenase component 2